MRMLFEDYGGALLHLIGRVLPVAADAEEVLHDVLLKIWTNIDQYDESRSRLFTWMARIARNAAVDRTRAKSYRHRRKTDPIQESVGNSAGHSTHIPVDGIGVSDLLQRLEPKHRAVLELLYFREFTQSEAAKELSIPLGTVKTRSRRALLRLREILNLS